MPEVSWVAVRCDISRMPAILRLRKRLKSDAAEVYVVRLLCWAKYYEPETGQLCNYSPDEIEAAAEWKGKPGELFEALIGTQVLMGPRHTLLFWEDTNGWLAKKAAKERARKRDDYARGKTRGRGKALNSSRSVGRSVGRSVARRRRGDAERSLRGDSAEKKGGKR